MSPAEVSRLVIAAILTVGVLFALVPHHYWGVLALAIKTGAGLATTGLLIHHYLQRWH